MSDTFDIYAILRLYANKMDTASIFFTDFCDYMQKYARHYLEDFPELVCYIDNPQTVVLKDLHELEDAGKVQPSSDSRGRRLIQIPSFYLDKIIHRYKVLAERPELPFPQNSDIDDSVAGTIIKQVYMSNDFVKYFDRDIYDNTTDIIRLILGDVVPPILTPGDMSAERFAGFAINKIRLFFMKNDFKGFILKKVLIANPGKEISMTNFMSQLMNKPDDAIIGLKHSGEAFIFWTTTCNFAKQDILKKNELTPDEISCVQSLMFIEYANNYYKTKIQQNLQRETALKNLELALKKVPYYFSLDDIYRFKNSQGIPLLGQYSEDDLQQFLRSKTADGDMTSLPALLQFQTENGNRYFVLKEKITSLVVVFCNETRKDVRNAIITSWNVLLKDFSQEPAMKDQREFEKKIEHIVHENNPLLYALLSASFFPLLAYEANDSDNTSQIKLFNKGKLLPYSTLLMLDRSELYTDAKIILPFWYTLPIISSILSLLFGHKQKSSLKKKSSPKIREQDETENQERSITPIDKKESFRKAAANVEKTIVRSGSTLDRDLQYYEDKWNRSLNQSAKENLEEDINSLIRSYLRKTLRTLPASSFTPSRIENLAQALVDTPSLMKIPQHDALLLYIQCYIVKLVLKI